MGDDPSVFLCLLMCYNLKERMDPLPSIEENKRIMENGSSVIENFH